MTKRWLLLAAVLVAAAAYAAYWFRPVNRVQRATYRLLAAAPKPAPGPDSPLDLARALAPFQQWLAPDVKIDIADAGSLHSRADALQALQFVRRCSDTLWLDHALVRAAANPDSTITVTVEVPFRIRLSRSAPDLSGGRRWDYSLHARLLWQKTPSGLRITRASLAPFRGIPLPDP
jgi:hypothetical protein